MKGAQCGRGSAPGQARRQRSVNGPLGTLFRNMDPNLSFALRPLKAGPLTLFLEPGGLRYIKLGSREVVRRIYAAVRDRNWGTVPGHLSDWAVVDRGNSFRVTFLSTHEGLGGMSSDGSPEEIRFAWRGEIEGGTDGSLRFSFDGQAQSTFLRNRIGFCVLHPITEHAGAPCKAIYANGTSSIAHFPRYVAAEQPLPGLVDLAGIAYDVAPGVRAEIRFEGDLFEVEDQRNWIDASFKTFCTPLRLPFPVEIRSGTAVRQSVSLRLECEPGVSASGLVSTQVETASRPVVIKVEQESRGRLTLARLGLGAPSHGRGHEPVELERLRALNLSHLRVDVWPQAAESMASLERFAGDANRIGASLELALHLEEVPEKDCAELLKALARRMPRLECGLARILILGLAPPTTTRAALDLARAHLGMLEAPIGAGTAADFYELNQSRPPSGTDFIFWSMNPQVHAFDNASIAETPSGAADQVESAHVYFPGVPLVVSPITLKPRFNPVATGDESPILPNELPRQVDPRQASLFGAGWTLAMLKRLAEAGVASVTCFETTGWRGVMETREGSALPEKFEPVAGGVYPLYHLLRDLGELGGGSVIATRSSEPLAVECLAVERNGIVAMLLANLTGERRAVELHLPSRSTRIEMEPHAIVRVNGDSPLWSVRLSGGSSQG